MKRFSVLLVSLIAVLTMAKAQTMNVKMGEVTYVFSADQAGDMVYNDGTSVTILGRTFTLDEGVSMEVTDDVVDDNTINVNYNGTSAQVTVAGNVARYLTVQANGAHVSIVQGADLPYELTYILGGTSSNGSFYMDGSLKASIVLNGLTLTNPDSAAVNIRNGKRISVELADGTTNTLTDGAGGTQKACFAVKGHTEFKGGGTLNITGKTAHAFWGKEYVELKKSVGTIKVLGAVGDGFNVNQYFDMKGGTVTITGVGDDGIQVSASDDETDEQNGQMLLKGGTLNVTATATAAKALKADTLINMAGTVATLKVTGALAVETDDVSYGTAVRALNFVMDDGELNITATGTASRGISADKITTNGGTINIANSGAGQTGTNDSYTAKGMKADTNISLNAGTITINMSGTGGKGIKSSGTYTQGLTDGTGPTLTVNTTGSSLGGSTGGGGGWWSREAPADFDEMPEFEDMPLPPPPSEELADTIAGIRFRGPGGGPGGGGPGGGGPGGPGQESSGSSAKAIKVQGTVVIYGGETTITTKTDGAEGLESKTSIDIQGGKHYLACYDDCMNSSGKIFFNGGVTVCYSNGNDAVDSNAGTAGAITIGNGVAFAYTTRGAPEEGFDCDNNSYIRITGTGIGISAGGAQGGGSSSSTISNAQQGYAFLTSTISYTANRYYTLSDASGNNLVTYSFQASISSSLSLLTATGMVKNSTYYIKYSTTAPTNAKTAFHGLYLGSTATGTNSVTSFTAK